MVEVEETKNALWRREEQLRRWEASETNSELPKQKNRDESKVKFQDGCVFLAACSSGDRDEVTELLAKGADINTTNVDGLTALHQACIDENLSTVKFLVEHGACINIYDNEGWTPLHATASCGFVNIARYLIEKGANLEAVNNDGELAIDLAEGKDMETLISETMEKQGIDADQARNEEEEVMLRDANQWLNSGSFDDVPHPKTGATALHIAAAKGYIKVMKILLEAGADINARDFDLWTPLHAAAHWGQEESCKILMEKFCDFELKNSAGQTALDIVDPEIEPVLEELKKKQALLIEQGKDIKIKDDDDILRGISPGKRRSSITRMSGDHKASLLLKNVEEERAQMDAMRQPVVEEKDEERRAEESDMSKEESEEASNSESDSEKKDDASIPASPQPWSQVNGSSHELSKSAVEDKDKIADDVQSPPPKGPVVPPSASVVQRTQSTMEPTTREELKRRFFDGDKGQPSSLSREVSKESETKEKNVSETTKTTCVVPPYLKTPVSRATSAPVTSLVPSTSRLTSVSRQDSNRIDSKPASADTLRRIDEMPSLWRASLRKTGSSGVVNECHSLGREPPEKIQRSVSIPRLVVNRAGDDSAQKRSSVGSSVGTGEEGDQKNRFTELYNRYATLLATNGAPEPRPSSAKPSVTTSSVAATTAPSSAGVTANTTSLSSQLLYGHPSSQLLRRQAGVGRREVADSADKGAPPVRPVSAGMLKNAEVGEIAVSLQRRSSDVLKRDDEKEVERKARAKKARETRRSTQGVSKEDLQKAEESLQAANAQRASVDVAPDKTSSNKVEDKGLDIVVTTTTSTTTPSTATLRSFFSERASSDSPASYRRSLRDIDTTTTTTAGYSPRGSRSSVLLSSTTATASQPSSTIASVLPSVTATTASQSSDVPAYRTQFRSKYLQQKEEEEAKVKAEEEAKRVAAAAAAAGSAESTEDKKDEKEDPSQKSAAIRAKKKRDSRRSTGRIDLGGLQGPAQDGQDDSKEGQEEKESKTATSQASSETPESSSQPISSGTGTYTRFPYSSSTQAKDADYKKLYEEEHALNEKLKKEMKQIQQDLTDSKAEMDRLKSSSSAITASSTKPLDATSERRMTFTEKRALERKISELEEELRNSESAKSELKADNQRLKDENGALIRVISKLSK